MDSKIKDLLEREAALNELLNESLGPDCHIDGNYVYDSEELIRPVTPKEKMLTLAIQEIRDMINTIK